MLKYLPASATELLLSILNKLISSNQIPLSWTEFKVIPIPKVHIINSFRPIVLSSALCKLVEHIFKNRFDWWLETNYILPDNLFAFRRGRGTIRGRIVLPGVLARSINPLIIKNISYPLSLISVGHSILFTFPY